jgi:lipopolysaccharide/colanic/teichoic acid biosynthesis glycosyltransferase
LTEVADINNACQHITCNPKPIGYRFLKRFADIIMSACVIVVGAIPGVFVAIAVAIDTKGTPFYTQKRMGLGGREFKMYKLRTMVADSDNVEKYFSKEQLAQWQQERKVDNDPRITPLGGWLRKYSIDEIPNFFNVFAGQMSVVGPRAITRAELVNFGDDVDLLLSVPSGITGLWQVEARNGATFESGQRQLIELDYARRASVGLDLRIAAKTVASMLKGTGQ